MGQSNILLVLTDQQQASTIESKSGCQTPNIDRLKDEGTHFSRAYTANPVCSPSRASLFTGVLPHNHGMVDVTHSVEPYRARFREDLDMWSRRLHEAGYRMGYFGKWHVERSNELEQFGFDEYDVLRGEGFDERYRDYRESLGLDPDVNLRSLFNVGNNKPDEFPAPYTDGHVVRQKGYRDLLLYGTHSETPEGMLDYYVYEQGLEFIEDTADHEDPWCLTVSADGPHDPYVVPEEYAQLYDPEDISKPENFHDNVEDKPEVLSRHQEVWRDMTWDDFAEATASYYAYCTFLDDQIGRLIDALERTGQLEDTIIVFASDHGDQMGGHRLLLKGPFPYEESYRVPMVIRTPEEYKSGQVLDDIVQLHDIGPTLTSLADAGDFPESSTVSPRNAVASVSGENIDTDSDKDDLFGALSLIPFLKGERPDNHQQEAFAEFYGVRFGMTQRVYWNNRFKYVFNANSRDELYDLEFDPHEMHNLAESDDHEETKVRMAKRMWEIIDETGDYTMSNTDYGVFRYAPTGPHTHEE